VQRQLAKQLRVFLLFYTCHLAALFSKPAKAETLVLEQYEWAWGEELILTAGAQNDQGLHPGILSALPTDVSRYPCYKIAVA